MKKSLRCALGFHKPETKRYFHHGVTSCYCTRCKQRLFQSDGKWFAITKNPKNICLIRYTIFDDIHEETSHNEWELRVGELIFKVTAVEAMYLRNNYKIKLVLF